jgi:hypothetical protein
MKARLYGLCELEPPMDFRSDILFPHKAGSRKAGVHANSVSSTHAHIRPPTVMIRSLPLHRLVAIKPASEWGPNDERPLRGLCFTVKRWLRLGGSWLLT